MDIKHWLGRPPRGSVRVERWTGKGWIADDGKLGLAFSGEDAEGYPRHWGPGCSCMSGEACPAAIAAKRSQERFRCSVESRMDRPRLRLVKKVA
jgi:hypothetical protein